MVDSILFCNCDLPDSRYFIIVASSAFLEKPRGSKNPKGAETPTMFFASNICIEERVGLVLIELGTKAAALDKKFARKEDQLMEERFTRRTAEEKRQKGKGNGRGRAIRGRGRGELGLLTALPTRGRQLSYTSPRHTNLCPDGCHHQGSCCRTRVGRGIRERKTHVEEDWFKMAH